MNERIYEAQINKKVLNIVKTEYNNQKTLCLG